MVKEERGGIVISDNEKGNPAHLAKNGEFAPKDGAGDDYEFSKSDIDRLFSGELDIEKLGIDTDEYNQLIGVYKAISVEAPEELDEFVDFVIGWLNDQDISKYYEGFDFSKIPSLANFKEARERFIESKKLYGNPYPELSEETLSFINKQFDKMKKNMLVGSFVPSRLLINVLEEGLQNQFYTHGSGGAYAPFLRAETSRDKFGTDISHWKSDGPSFEKYGCLRDKRSGLYDSAATQYGGVYIEVRDDVQERTTFCFGDSLDKKPIAPKLLKDSIDPYMFVTRYKDDEIRGIFSAYTNIDEIGQAFYRYVELQLHGEIKPTDIKCIYMDEDTYNFRFEHQKDELKKLTGNAGISIKIVPKGFALKDAIEIS